MRRSQAQAHEGSDSSPTGWQRARRPEHKAERRRAILDAAEALIDEQGVDGATLSAIARRAGLSKANCYRYFESREAILLAVAIEEARDWTREVVDRLAGLSAVSDVDAVARTYAQLTAGHPRFCMLVSSLSSVLEHNISVEAVAEFKRTFHPLLFGSANAVRSAIPELSVEQAYAFLRFFGLLTIGTWPNANPAPAVVEVLEGEEFAPMRIDLEETLFEHARVLLRGLITDSSSDPSSSGRSLK